MGRYTNLSEYKKKEIDEIKAQIQKAYDQKQDELAEVKAQIQKAGLNYRYFRNNKEFRKKTNRNHLGVICVGYKIIKDDNKGVNFTMCVAFCSPKDSFSRFEAKKHLVRRYFNNQTINITVTYGSEKEILNIIKCVWNSQKIPLEKLGIKSFAPGKELVLRSWMKYIR